MLITAWVTMIIGIQFLTHAATEWELEKGCAAIGTCHWVNNDDNRFSAKFNRPYMDSQNCDLQKYQLKYKKAPCAGPMNWVCSEKYQVNICMDTELVKDASGNPAGNFSRDSCELECRSRGALLPTNNEWLVAANGTQFKDCNIRKPHPCAKENFSMNCLQRNFNRVPGSVARPNCLSSSGVRDMVGIYGSWVAETHDGSGWMNARTYNEPTATRGFFNGGLWPQSASTVFYQTRAHQTSYHDYSIGCRCVKLPQQ